MAPPTETIATQPNAKKRKLSEKELALQEEKKKWIKWLKTQAREVILDDLRFGRLPRDEAEMSAEDAWSFYKDKPEFEKVVFSQFKARLSDHRKQITKEWLAVKDDEEAWQKDQNRGFKDTQTHNRRGEPILHLTPIEDLIRKDVQEGKHKGMSRAEFRGTRPEYCNINNTIFKGKVKQEVHRQKFIHHCEQEREKKGRKKPATYEQIN